jgi:hypothetical protein
MPLTIAADFTRTNLLCLKAECNSALRPRHDSSPTATWRDRVQPQLEDNRLRLRG